MSVDFSIQNIPPALRAAESLAEKYEVRLGIHNHGDRHWLGNWTALNWVLQQSSARIGVCLDTAWAIDSGENPVEWVRKLGVRLHGLHLKDFLYDEKRKLRDVVVGTGILNLPELATALEETGFNGYTVLEYEADVDNPVPALNKCVHALLPVY